MRSFGSRAMRTLIARGFGFAALAELMPCICNTPPERATDRLDRRRDQFRQPVPRPLIPPEVQLKTWSRREAERREKRTSLRARRLRVVIGCAKPRSAHRMRDIAEPDRPSSLRNERPDVDRRSLLIGPRKISARRIAQIELIQQQCIQTRAIEIEEGDAAEQVPSAAQHEDRLRIVPQEFRQFML